MNKENLLNYIGNTPLIKLVGFTTPNDATIYAKAEFLNVGGSIKTRASYAMIIGAIKSGKLKKGGRVVEVSSGNQGVGLALVGAIMGFKVTIIMPDSVSVERSKIIKAYGAQVITVKDEGDIGACINKCMQLAQQMKREDGLVFIPDQFSNYDNLLAHEKQTAQEIISKLKGKIDGFCVGVGSGGTLGGIGKSIKRINKNAQVWAVEPENSAVISGKTAGSHIQMGIGDGFIPPILDRSIIDNVVTVSDETALYYAKKLACTNGALCGISSGANLAGSVMLAKKLGKGKVVVTVLPDTGERYFSTPLFN